jgi:hypothetical protein
MKEKATVWQKWECGAGSRFTTVVGGPFSEDLHGSICNFSGCNCGTRVKSKGYTENVAVASQWFQTPTARTVTFNFQQTGFNAHKAVGKFTYDTAENAQKAAARMRGLKGYSNVRLTTQETSVN